MDVFAPGTNILSSVSYKAYNPGIYDDETEAALTGNYGVFGYENDDTIKPSSAGIGAASFEEPKAYIADEDSGKLVPADNVSFSVSKDWSDNRRTDSSLRVDIKNARDGDQIYIVFPYETAEDTEAGNVILEAEVRYIDEDEDRENKQRVMTLSEMLMSEDGDREVRSLYTDTVDETYDGMNSRLALRNQFSYEETVAEDVILHGLEISVIKQGDGDETFYLDNLAVSTKEMASLVDKYDVYSGTSMAAPVVTGAAALLCALYPEQTKSASDLRSLLLSSAEKSDELYGMCRTGAKIDLSNILSGDFSPSIEGARIDTDSELVFIYGSMLGVR